MTLEEQAASLSRDAIVSLLVSKRESDARVEELTRQLDWLKRQLFGPKSERRLVARADARQGTLGEQLMQEAARVEPPTETVRGYARRRSRPVDDGSVEESKLRFDASVPVEEIRVPTPQIDALSPESYDIVGVARSPKRA
jgi:hypothetical protein